MHTNASSNSFFYFKSRSANKTHKKTIEPFIYSFIHSSR
ncbi:hypothetical protein SynMVIR181_00770 [Synechococcus sp. MVIR-18-1]|nr:hypothetical protein SynMVIR181_00770 [Synechococcus sp. MVIR-18-1]